MPLTAARAWGEDCTSTSKRNSFLLQRSPNPLYWQSLASCQPTKEEVQLHYHRAGNERWTWNWETMNQSLAQSIYGIFLNTHLEEILSTLFCCTQIPLSQRRRRAYSVSGGSANSPDERRLLNNVTMWQSREEIFWFRIDDWWWEFGHLLLWSGEWHGNILLRDLQLYRCNGNYVQLKLILLL